MKRKAALLLVFVLLFAILPSFAGEERSTDAIVLTLEGDWSTYLWIHETLYGSCSEALDYALQYCGSKSWDDLVRARASAVYALNVLNRYSNDPIGSSLTAEDYQALYAMGMDLNDLQAEFGRYDTDTLAWMQSIVIPAWQNYLSELMAMFISDADLFRIREWCGCVQGYILAEMKFLYLMNNYTVLQLPPDNAEGFLAWCRGNVPGLMALYVQPFATENDVLNEMNTVVGEMAESVLDFEEYQTTYQVLYEMEAEASRKLTEEVNGIGVKREEGMLTQEEARAAMIDLVGETYSGLQAVSGVSAVLPYPSGMNLSQAEYTYYWKDSEGNVSAVERPFRLEVPPNCFHMKCSGINREGFDNYVQALVNMGLTLADKNEEAALFYLDNGTEIMVSYTDSLLQIHTEGSGACFVFAPYLLTEYWYRIAP